MQRCLTPTVVCCRGPRSRREGLSSISGENASATRAWRLLRLHTQCPGGGRAALRDLRPERCTMWPRWKRLFVELARYGAFKRAGTPNELAKALNKSILRHWQPRSTTLTRRTRRAPRRSGAARLRSWSAGDSLFSRVASCPDCSTRKANSPVDLDGRVLDIKGKPIPNLFARAAALLGGFQARRRRCRDALRMACSQHSTGPAGVGLAAPPRGRGSQVMAASTVPRRRIHSTTSRPSRGCAQQRRLHLLDAIGVALRPRARVRSPISRLRAGSW